FFIDTPHSNVNFRKGRSPLPIVLPLFGHPKIDTFPEAIRPKSISPWTCRHCKQEPHENQTGPFAGRHARTNNRRRRSSPRLPLLTYDLSQDPRLPLPLFIAGGALRFRTTNPDRPYPAIKTNASRVAGKDLIAPRTTFAT